MDKLNRIKVIEEELVQLKAELEQEKYSKNIRHLFGKGEIIFFIDSSYDIIQTNWEETLCFASHIKYGNAFKTSEQADFRLFQLEVEQQMRVIAEKLNDGEQVDRFNTQQEKYYIYYNYDRSRLEQERSYYLGGRDILCTSFIFINECIDTIGEKELVAYFESFQGE